MNRLLDPLLTQLTFTGGRAEGVGTAPIVILLYAPATERHWSQANHQFTTERPRWPIDQPNPASSVPDSQLREGSQQILS